MHHVTFEGEVLAIHRVLRRRVEVNLHQVERLLCSRVREHATHALALAGKLGRVVRLRDFETVCGRREHGRDGRHRPDRRGAGVAILGRRYIDWRLRSPVAIRVTQSGPSVWSHHHTVLVVGVVAPLCCLIIITTHQLTQLLVQRVEAARVAQEGVGHGGEDDHHEKQNHPHHRRQLWRAPWRRRRGWWLSSELGALSFASGGVIIL
mmetsp:Transcript_35628/g.95593  ORF Transcript_35628/g.95593 Transcript_35628/m.95593 type:complete len:207 (+) Transcript_35628:890-1510(+)